MSERTVYGKAADIIRERGWYQGATQGPNGCVCLAGALYLAAGIELPDRPDHMTDEGYEILTDVRLAPLPQLEYLRERLGEPVGQWNDALGRTEAEAVALLEELDRESTETAA